MKKNFWYAVGCVILLFAGGVCVVFPDRRGKRSSRDRRRGRPRHDRKAEAPHRHLLRSGNGAPPHGDRHHPGQPPARFSLPSTTRKRASGRKAVSVAVDTAALKLHDGPATLTLTAVDYSLWKNRTVVDAAGQRSISCRPRSSSSIRRTTSIPGGTCVVAYRLSETASSTGVQVGDLFYPAYPVTLAGKPGYVAYFALPLDATPGVPADPHHGARSGRKRNRQRHPRADPEKEVPQRHDGPLPTPFSDRRCPNSRRPFPLLRGKTPIETFIYVNTQLRADNSQDDPVRLQKIGTAPALAGHLSPDEKRRPDGPLRRPPDLSSTAENRWAKASTSAWISHPWPMPRSRPPTPASSVSPDRSGSTAMPSSSTTASASATLYAHMSGIQVEPDQTVKAGRGHRLCPA